MVLPTRNEADNLPALLARLRKTLKAVDFELVFIDDSDDSTAACLATAAGVDPRIRVLHRQPGLREGGLSTAVVLGLHEARGRLVCVMDADLQHPPETIPALLAAERQGADLVVASRYLPGGSRQGLDGHLRQLVSRAATLLARTVFVEARASTDPLAGFFLCRSALLRGVEFRPVGFKVLLELLVCSPPPRVVDVPLRFQARAAGTSKASLSQGLLFLRHVWSLVRDVPGSARPLKFAAVGLSGLVLFLVVLEFGGNLFGWPVLSAWAVAFVISGLWNFSWNLRFTFADLRRERYPLTQRYVSSALTSGGVQLVVFLGLVGTTLALLVDGLIAAVVGMAVNAAFNWQLAQRHRRPSASPVGVEQLLAQVSRVGGAQLALLLDGEGQLLSSQGSLELGSADLVRHLAEQARQGGRPLLWTEPPSTRPQPRTNFDLTSMMVLPLELTGSGSLTVALQRRARTGFGSADLDAAIRQLDRLRPRLALGLPRHAAAGAPIAGRPPAALSGSRGQREPERAGR